MKLIFISTFLWKKVAKSQPAAMTAAAGTALIRLLHYCGAGLLVPIDHWLTIIIQTYSAKCLTIFIPAFMEKISRHSTDQVGISMKYKFSSAKTLY